MSTKLKILYCLLFLGLLPLWFGGAHHTTWFLAAGCAAFLAAAAEIYRPAVTQTGKPNCTVFSESHAEWLALATLCAAVIIIAIYHGLRTIEHPVLGTIPVIDDFRPIFGFFAGVTLLLAPASLFARGDEKLLRTALLLSGLCAAIVALAQFLSDNGHLLWYFAPDYVFESNRARWPFVNPNHLGAFLLTPIVLGAHALLVWLSSVLERTAAKTNRVRLAPRPFPMLAGLAVLFCIPALVATQSRSAWGAAAIGLIGVAAFQITRRSLTHRSRLLVLALSTLLALVIGWTLSLSDQLANLTAQRIDFASKESLEDLRFKYWSDSLALIQRSPLLGVGPGGFAREIESVARPELAGLNPQYLHNEVLQFFLEYGGLAGLLLCAMIGIVLRRSSHPLTICFCCLFIISLVDFPFRMAAIVAQIGIIFTLSKIQRIKAHE